MLTTKFKKILSLVLSILMIFTMVPATVFTIAASGEQPTMMQFTAASSQDFHKYYNKVYSVTFLDEIDTAAMNGAIESWDISANKGSGEVMAWTYKNVDATAAAGADRYDVYIAGDGGVWANPQSGFIFYLFSELVEVNGLENFKTDNATTFVSMFENCYKIKKISIKNWNTNNVTSLENMFRNCNVLRELDLSSFNTSKVTTMRFMFYLCKELKYIYVGDGWTTESIANMYDGVFNCCYAIIGGTDDLKTNQDIYEANPNPPISNFYATVKEDGGYLTYKAPEVSEKYTVTYKFIGDIIPEGVTAPADAVYEEGTTVTVADASSAEHYIFSGWTTEDADVENGEFVINNDVEFVGSWTRLYQVRYEYDDAYELPAGYPEIPDVELWYAPGEDVPVYGIPYVHGYIFVGWNTGDAEIIGDEFTMPENDVVLYGYYKKPVNNIEILGGELTIDIGGEKVKVEVYIDPPDATFDGVIYESGDESIVTVDKDGMLTPVGVGTTTITITSVDDPTKTDTVNVTVKIPVTDITVDRTEIDLNKGDTNTITVTQVQPAEATNKEVVYESSNTDVVTVDENGNITAVGDGTATITVTSKDNKTVKEIVTVKVKTPVTKLTATDDFSLAAGEEKNVEAKVNEDATDKTLVYESKDPSIVKIDNEGNVIAVGEGTTTITITSKDNPEIRKEITVTVYENYNVTYEFVGDIVPENIEAPEAEEYRGGTEVTVKENVSADGYIFSGWSTEDNVDITDGKFIINNDVHFKGSFIKLYPVYYIYTNEPQELPENAPDLNEMKLYAPGEAVEVEEIPVVDGYTFSGWYSDDVVLLGESFSMPEKTVVLYGCFEKIEETTTEPTTTEPTTTEPTTTEPTTTEPTTTEPTTTEPTTTEPTTTEPTTTEPTTEPTTKPSHTITVPENVTVFIGEKKSLGIIINPPDGTIIPNYHSSDESVVKVDLNGNITGIRAGAAVITVDFGNGDIRAIPVAVVSAPSIPKKHHITFGKTDGIGWYEVSVNGGDFFPQGPNSTLEVMEGSILVVRVQDMWIDDEFDFYVNGKKVPMDPANTITVVVDGYMLIGALSMDAEVPDVDESLNIFQKIANLFKRFINWIKGWFR